MGGSTPSDLVANGKQSTMVWVPPYNLGYIAPTWRHTYRFQRLALQSNFSWGIDTEVLYPGKPAPFKHIRADFPDDYGWSNDCLIFFLFDQFVHTGRKRMIAYHTKREYRVDDGVLAWAKYINPTRVKLITSYKEFLVEMTYLNLVN